MQTLAAVPTPRTQPGSFTMVPDALLAEGRLSPGAKMLWIRLASYLAPDQQFCWPGQATLAVAEHCSEREIRNRLAELESAGWVTRRRRAQGRTTVYRPTTPGESDRNTRAGQGPRDRNARADLDRNARAAKQEPENNTQTERALARRTPRALTDKEQIMAEHPEDAPGPACQCAHSTAAHAAGVGACGVDWCGCQTYVLGRRLSELPTDATEAWREARRKLA